MFDAGIEVVRWGLSETLGAALLDPQSRLHVGYLVSSALFSWLCCRHLGLLSYRARGLRTDAQLWLLSALLRLTFASLAIVLTTKVALAVAFTVAGLGRASTSSGLLPSWAITVAYGFCLFLVEDASRYALHRALHRVPWLFRFHSVHHSATTMTPLTFYRTHPVETVLYLGRHVLSTAPVSGIFLGLFRNQVSLTEPLTYYLFVTPFLVLGANVRHSHVWLSFGARLERWFISPAQHQLHHGRTRENQSCNYGSVLAIWDRAFSTLQIAHGRKQPRFGLMRADRTHSESLASALLDPLLGGLAGPALKRGAASMDKEKGEVLKNPALSLALDGPQTKSNVRT